LIISTARLYIIACFVPEGQFDDDRRASLVADAVRGISAGVGR
jgi:hypothetical protein